MPSAADFTPDRYRREVLDPARDRGGVLPADLLQRYAIPEPAGQDPVIFSARVDQVVKHWRALKQKRVYQALAAGLLAAHADLVVAGQVTYAHFSTRRAEDLAAAHQSLDSMVAALAAGTDVISRATIPLLSAAVGDGLDQRAVEAALAGHGVVVVDRIWTLPAEPVDATRPRLAADLRILGLNLAAEAVFGPTTVRAGFQLRSGFQLHTGERITAEVLADRRRQQAPRARDERKTALENVLAALTALLDQPERLAAVLTWQLVDVLRPRLAAGLPARAVAAGAVQLGLDRAEAAELALVLTDQASVRDPVRVRAEQALTAGRLRTARQLVPALATTDEVRHRVEAAAARYDELVTAADAARERGHRAAEIALVTQALDLTEGADDELRARLRALPPAAPVQLRATVDGGQVRLDWSPGAGPAGRIRYRVVRGRTPTLTATAGDLVEETEQVWAVDSAPPAGLELHYGVLARRSDGDAWSTAAFAGPVRLLPEVRDPHLEAGENLVTGSWQLPVGAVGAVVTCRGDQDGEPGTDTGPAAERTVPATAAGFTDVRGEPGRSLTYRIRATYLDQDGRSRLSPGLVRRITVEAAADPVHRLRARVMPGEYPYVVLEWTPPERGVVRIHRSDQPLPWPLGTAVPLAELSRYGRPVPAPIETEEPTGTAQLIAQHRAGRTWFTALTVGTEQALIGSSVMVATADPVRGLRAKRYDGRIRLGWDWPDSGHLARVEWWPEPHPAERSGSEPTGGGTVGPEPVNPGTVDPGRAGNEPAGVRAADCGRRRFEDDGGFEIAVEAGPVRVSVVTLRRDREGEIVSPPAQILVAGAGITVRYGFRYRTRWTPWRGSHLVLLADRSCQLPDLTVVRGPGSVRPLRPESGAAIVRLPGLALIAGLPKVIPIPEPAGAGPERLSCFFAGRAPAGIALVPTDRRI